MSNKKRPEDMNLNELIEAVEAEDPDALAYYNEKIMTPETKARLKEMATVVGNALDRIRPAFEQLKPSFEQMQAFYKEHKAAYDALSDEEQAIALIKSLSLEDLQQVVEKDAAAKAWAFIEKAKKASEIDATELYYAALDCIEIGDFIALYELKNRQTYRTKAQAQEAGAIKDLPKSLIIPTYEGYQNSVSLYQSGGAYLQPLSSVEALKFKDGKLYFENMTQLNVEAELQNLKTKEGIENIDLPVLRVFYAIICNSFQVSDYTRIEDVITMDIADLAEYMGLPRNLNKQEVQRLLDKLQSYHNIVGVVHGMRNGKPVKSYYQVLNFEKYEDKNRTVTFSSPYMNYVIKTLYSLAIRKTKDGKTKHKKNGDPLRLPTHSYLIDSSIAKERNKAAVENVVILVSLIERAGDNIPRIKASTLIEHNVQLAERLETAANPRALLKTTFTKTWELLKTKTRLQETYKNIQLPEPNDPAFMPTMKTLNELVFTFPHEGKK